MKKHRQDADHLNADLIFEEITREVSNVWFVDRLWIKLIDMYFGNGTMHHAHSGRHAIGSSLQEYRGMDYEET